MTSERTLATLLPLAAERAASAPALRDRDRSFTWEDAALAAGRLGAALDQVGIGPGDRVGVHYRKSAEAFLAMHAVVQRGAIAVPLDPTAAPGYLAEVAGQTGCQALLTHDPCRASALALVGHHRMRAVLGLSDQVASGNGGAPGGSGTPAVSPNEIDGLDPVPPRRVAASDLAYLITTSGSTGVPKGISHTHGSALAYVAFKLDAYDFTPDDRVSDIAPNHFDISTLALWVTPAVGAANVVVTEPYQMLPASLSQLAADEGITVWYSVPYLLTQLLQRGDLDQRDLSALRWVLFGGELVPPQVLAQLMARWPGARFSNVYGPAEVNACTVHHLGGPPQGDEPIPIGLPVGPTRVALIDRHALPDPDALPDRAALPDLDAARTSGGDAGLEDRFHPGFDPERAEPRPGDQGEIWVSAPTMMAGYWERPDLDAAIIITDAEGRRWYRTGDVGYRLSSGQLVFSGRLDHQVKVRGHRVELEAVEAVLESAPGVANAVATVIRPGDGADVVVAGVAPQPGAALDPDAVRRHATAHLPAYAVPTTIEPLDPGATAATTTGSGKLDRRRLRAQLAQQVTGRPDSTTSGGSS